MKKDRKRFSAKNNISSGSFYPSVGSIVDKTSSKVIGKVNAYDMHHTPSPPVSKESKSFKILLLTNLGTTPTLHLHKLVSLFIIMTPFSLCKIYYCSYV
jgi:predicted membrane chloride channel (bestrophin family)